ncbi:hypothetical protein [Curvibacter gracilis]|uniref:hypothetical protein n=1 Tax=Curvibacter gracilis TaxID=230310 RepID=UPI000480F77E|nr:hypothetical protein [Curvibacter gracilis]
MPLPKERPFDDADIEVETPSWQPLPGASSHPGASLCWVWLKVLAVGFLLALAVGLIGLALDMLWL